MRRAKKGTSRNEQTRKTHHQKPKVKALPSSRSLPHPTPLAPRAHGGAGGCAQRAQGKACRDGGRAPRGQSQTALPIFEEGCPCKGAFIIGGSSIRTPFLGLGGRTTRSPRGHRHRTKRKKGGRGYSSGGIDLTVGDWETERTTRDEDGWSMPVDKAGWYSVSKHQ